MSAFVEQMSDGLMIFIFIGFILILVITITTTKHSTQIIYPVCPNIFDQDGVLNYLKIDRVASEEHSMTFQKCI
jgi:hypothetical protein